MTVRIIHADVLAGLAQLEDDSVHCAVTSPPYFGLRCYGVDGQLGLEPTLAEHLDALVAVFEEVRRVLRPDGVAFVNYGPSYASAPGAASYGISGKVLRDFRENGHPSRSLCGACRAGPTSHNSRTDAPRAHEQGGVSSGPIPESTESHPRRSSIEGFSPRSSSPHAEHDSRGHHREPSAAETSQPAARASSMPQSSPRPRDVSMQEHSPAASSDPSEPSTFLPEFQASSRMACDHAEQPLHKADNVASSSAREQSIQCISGYCSRCGAWADDLRSDIVDIKHTMPGVMLKPKDMTLIPERLAIALQDDGWYVRDCIVWAKPNPMPSSVTDRCTPSYELVYMLVKNGASPTFWLHEHGKGSRTRPEPDYVWRHQDTGEERSAPPAGDDPYLPKWKRRNLWRGVAYWWDAEAIREPHTEGTHSRGGNKNSGTGLVKSDAWNKLPPTENPAGRNARNVWTIATAPMPEAHFATFPPELVRRCLLAACPERVCASCGAGWVREVERTQVGDWRGSNRSQDLEHGNMGAVTMPGYVPPKTLGWHPSCDCQAETRPGTVLDCFGGSGTVGLVADRMNRDAILIELSAEYVAMARKRIEGDAPLFADLPEHEPAPSLEPAEQGGLFDE